MNKTDKVETMKWVGDMVRTMEPFDHNNIILPILTLNVCGSCKKTLGYSKYKIKTSTKEYLLCITCYNKLDLKNIAWKPVKTTS